MPIPNEIQYPIGLMSVPHIIFLAVLIPSAIILAFVLSRKIGFSKNVVWVCFIIGILCEIEKILFFMQELPGGGYRLPAEHIPFNLCPFQIFLMFILVISADIKKRSFLITFMYPTMVAGSAFAMFVPAVIIQGYHGLLELATYRYFIYHALLVFMGFYLYMSKPIQYSIKSLGTAIIGIFSAAIVMIWVNAFFGWDPTVNFFFLVRPPAENLPFLNLDRGWGFYFFQIMCLGGLFFTMCYIREIVRDLPGLVKTLTGKFKKQA